MCYVDLLYGVCCCCGGMSCRSVAFSKLYYYFALNLQFSRWALFTVPQAMIFTFTSKLCCLRITMLCFVLLLNRWRSWIWLIVVLPGWIVLWIYLVVKRSSHWWECTVVVLIILFLVLSSNWCGNFWWDAPVKFDVWLYGRLKKFLGQDPIGHDIPFILSRSKTSS